MAGSGLLVVLAVLAAATAELQREDTWRESEGEGEGWWSELRAGEERTLHMTYTFYGWIDQCPPGAYMGFPRPGSNSGKAQGDGSHANPISFAGTTVKTKAWYMAPGTVVYIAHLQKYFIMEDECTDCDDKAFSMDLWLGPAAFAPGVIDCENQMTPPSTRRFKVLVNPANKRLPVDTRPFHDGVECMEKIEPADKCVPNRDPTNGCNICQLNWDAIPEPDGSGQSAYPEKGLTCEQLATQFQSSVSRLRELNPGWDCSQRIPYSDDNFCQGDSCGNP